MKFTNQQQKIVDKYKSNYEKVQSLQEEMKENINDLIKTFPLQEGDRYERGWINRYEVMMPHALVVLYYNPPKKNGEKSNKVFYDTCMDIEDVMKMKKL